nr:hypothetical protein BaRGS_010827 [Batillaria attramentaria]
MGPGTTLSSSLTRSAYTLVLTAASVVTFTPSFSAATNNSSTVSPSSSDNSTSDEMVYGDEIFSERVELFGLVRPEVITVDRYVTIFIYCIGFPGNILSFIVWIQKRMRHSSGCYLAALALDDFIFLSLHVVLESHMVWGSKPLDTPVVCQVFPIMFLAAQYLGPLLVLGFTTERYISICHPFRREKYCTVRRAKLVIGILVGLAVSLSSVQGYFYHFQEGGNGTYECGPRPDVSRGGNLSLWVLWNLSIEILTFLLVPLAVLVLNIRVILEMRRLSRVEQVTLHGHSQRTSATTVMLLAVSFYLIITTLPVTIAYSLFFEFTYEFPYPSINETVADPMFQRWVTYELVLTSIKEFGTTQYAFNIIFYVITGKIFRKELKNLFRKVLCGKFTMSISKEYSSLRSSIRGGSTKTKSMWVSVNGHGHGEKGDVGCSEETNV